MMDQPGFYDAARQGHAQRGQRQFIFHRAIQRPPAGGRCGQPMDMERGAPERWEHLYE